MRLTAFHSTLALLLAVLAPGRAAAQESAHNWSELHASGMEASRSGRNGEAQRLLTSAVAEAEKFGPGDLRLADSMTALADVLQEEGKFDQAAAFYQKALAIYQAPELADNRTDKALCLESYARLLEKQGQQAEASRLAAAASTIWQRLWANYTYAGVVAEDQNELSEAEGYFRAALQCAERIQRKYGRAVSSLDNLVDLFCKNGRYAEAEPFCKRSLLLCEKALGREHQKTLAAADRYTSLLRKTSGNAEADAWAAEWKMRGNRPSEHPPVIGDVKSPDPHPARRQ